MDGLLRAVIVILLLSLWVGSWDVAATIANAKIAFSLGLALTFEVVVTALTFTLVSVAGVLFNLK